MLSEILRVQPVLEWGQVTCSPHCFRFWVGEQGLQTDEETQRKARELFSLFSKSQNWSSHLSSFGGPGDPVEELAKPTQGTLCWREVLK